ncbi:tRNA (5-methylaminomethyl-2-thiouridine)(34)-methyltransferase MnmD [Mucilaginibacter ginkgonis]|uniref:tRNA (5-methylaminomethyl-2-thiouridine)(34)-methyltransferase MnmD n=1 Tax=Mucilaginibacter ginkgonis TaxID=2682091 RepID=UPI001FC80FD3|nr:tRNA (5-methylaminomethyl-2-thiouridine)(34)-methyltransferase MnmD [Mucilaginibacter ginkgonis]
MDQTLKIVDTADGSKTIWNEQVGEHYHSRNGALQESRHVFVEAGLQYFLSVSGASGVNILEVGFGTRLNFLLSANHCIKTNVNLNYVGIEAYPLSKQLIGQTGYDQYLSTDIWQNFLDKYLHAFQSNTEIAQKIKLNIAPVELLKFSSAQLFDIIYFDAFAAAHQPEMWNAEAISHTVKFLKPGGVLVTYAITGDLKRMLKGLGFKIEKLPGAAGKREMLRATN